VTIAGELAAIKAVARQLRRATAPPDPRRLQSWARSLDDAVRGLERQARFLRDGGGEPLSVAVPPGEGIPGTDRPAPDPDAAQRRRDLRAQRARGLPNVGTAGRSILDAVASVAPDPQWAGLTDWELAQITELSPNTVRPRRGELVTGGWLLDSGATRTHHGRAHRVWVLSDRAAGELAGQPPPAPPSTSRRGKP
jgi:hypothetical protein